MTLWLGQQNKWSRVPLMLCVMWVASGCASLSTPSPAQKQAPPIQEQFASAATFSRIFEATPRQICEAARRALLSQGYIVQVDGQEVVLGQKSFQPQTDRHVQMHIRVTCVPENQAGSMSMGFVSALQDSYALKMASNSASLGVSMLGSVSVPVAAGHDSMIKIGSETVTSDQFYDGFFDLMRRYLLVDAQSLGKSEVR